MKAFKQLALNIRLILDRLPSMGASIDPFKVNLSCNLSGKRTSLIAGLLQR